MSDIREDAKKNNTGIGAIVIARVHHRLADNVGQSYAWARPSDLVKAAIARITDDKSFWPWTVPQFTSSTSYRDNLVEAGAIIAAAIDAYDREQAIAKAAAKEDATHGTS